MQAGIPLFPERASTMAGRVDNLFFFVLAVAAFFSVLIAAGILYFAVKYRRRKPDAVGTPLPGSMKLETAWMVIPLILAMVMFGWGASLFMAIRRPPADALEIYVVGKQWMWKLQHQEGQREINELHVPKGRDIKLILASEDVIHDFFVPAFRVKTDVVPGRYTTLWFRATKTGRYHMFCAQYCGTNHAIMGGWVTVLEPAEFQTWLSGGPAEGPLSAMGQKLFQSLACHTCHAATAQARGPSLEGVYGSTVQLDNGQTVVADDAYLRESILTPKAKIVAGYQPLMPTFQGLVSEEQVLQLIAYIKSLKGPQAAPGAAVPAPATAPPDSREKKRP